jgi:phage-related protein
MKTTSAKSVKKGGSASRSPFFQKNGVAGSAFFQTKLTIGKTNDYFEKEADQVADRVVQQKTIDQPFTTISPLHISNTYEPNRSVSDEDVQASELETPNLQLSGLLGQKEISSDEVNSEGFIQSKGGDRPVAPSDNFEIKLSASKGGGERLPERTRSEMETAIGANFSGVRVHNDAQSAGMSNEIGARAFTTGNDIYFNEGQYDPHSSSGKHLLAHELTHTVQQGASGSTAAIQNKQESPSIQLLPDWILEELNDYASYIPGWTLFTVIIGFNPLLGRGVSRNATNLVRGLLELIPVFGVLLYDKLNELGILQGAFNWINGQLEELDLSLDRLERTIERAWDDVSIVRGLDYNIGVLERTFGALYRDVKSFASRVADKVLELIKDALVSFLKSFAESIPGYTLLTKILGRDPLTDESVEATTADIIADFLMLIGAERELQKMQEEGTLAETAAWIDEQLALLNFSFEEIKNLFVQTWDSFSFEDVRDPLGAYQRVASIWSPFLTRVGNFAYNVATKVVEFIKNALLSQLRAFALEVRGYHLLTVILGSDPFTGEVVPRTIENIIRGFMSLMEGGEQQFQEMKQSGAIDRTTQRVQAAVEQLGFTLEYIVGLFMGLWNSFTIDDIFQPLDAFQRIIDTIANPIARLFRFIVKIIRIVIEVVLEIMQLPVNLITRIISNVEAAWNLIKSDPVGFIKNLLRGVKQGFVQFFDNIATHLLNGVTGWLFKELEDAGITPPQDLSLSSILQLVMQVLGITVDRVWQKIGEKIGPERMERLRSMIDKLEGAWAFIKDVMENGPGAIWKYVSDMLSNLWDVVLDAVKNWAITRIIQAVTAKLLSMLDPTGIMAVVNSFIAIFRAIQSFIAYLREMLETFSRFVEGVLAVAMGNIQPAAEKLENALGNAMPIVIGFLANQVGLRGLGSRIGEMISAVRERVDRALDWLIDKAISAGRGILNMGRNALAAVRNWWASRKEVTTNDGHQHTIYFDGSGTSARLMMQSTPQTMNAYLDEIQNVHQIPASALAPARAKAAEIDQLKSQNVPEDQQQQHGADINAKIDELAGILANIPMAESTGTNASTQYGPLRQGYGSFARLSYLESPHPAGSDPSVGNTSEYDRINARRKGSGAYYIKGHLLNENLGGPGNSWSNLTPLTQQANSDHKNNFENPVKMAVNGKTSGYSATKLGYLKNFEVIANYGRSAASGTISLLRDTETDDLPGGMPDNTDPFDLADVLEAEQFVPVTLGCTAIISDGGSSNERTVSYTVNNDIQYGNLSHYSLNPEPRSTYVLADKVTEGDPEGSANRLQELEMIGPRRAENIYNTIVDYGRIPSFKRDIGITKKALERHNPRYRIKGSN